LELQSFIKSMNKNIERTKRLVLRISELTVAYRQRNEILDAVRDFSLEIESGQKYGLVGESGSGKTTIALAILNYLGEDGFVRGGRIELNGENILNFSKSQLRRVWGSEVSLVPQNPQASLNPSMRIGDQIAEILASKNGNHDSEVRSKALSLLARVNIPDPERVVKTYPYQISGGMQQRVLIAMALSLNPDLLILDEPTTALDVTTEASILDLLQEEIASSDASALYVTHNMGVVAQFCDRIAVLYAGDLVEDGPIEEIFQKPLHPYTMGLLASIPNLGATRREAKLFSIPGQIPPLGARPDGCVFAPRCPIALDICSSAPELTKINNCRSVRCHRWEEIEKGLIGSAEFSSSKPEDSIEKPFSKPVHENTQILLDLKNVSVHFETQRSIADLLSGHPPSSVKAVKGFNLSVLGGMTVGLVGESGSGKTTLGRGIMGLEHLTEGEVEFSGKVLPVKLSERDLETIKDLQIVFQNPDEALNPHLRVGTSLRIPIQRLLSINRDEAGEKAKRLLEAVQLSVETVHKMPHQLSGGEKQRVALARSFASNPSLLIVDEPVSSLDVSVQAAVLNLLDQQQVKTGNSYLFISHNLAVIGYMADIVAVIYLGYLMEVTRIEELFKPPYHPYTEALLSAVPVPDPSIRKHRIRLVGDLPSPLSEFRGCPFNNRCPRVLGEICETRKPEWQFDQHGNRYFCHIPLEELEKTQDVLIDQKEEISGIND
jgi:peptide/nickel transport system ATP-binding protein